MEGMLRRNPITGIYECVPLPEETEQANSLVCEAAPTPPTVLPRPSRGRPKQDRKRSV